MALLPVMSWLLLLAFASLSRSYTLPAGAAVTPKPIRPAIRGRDGTGLDKRDITTVLSTCGYLDGDPNQPRTANSGFNCLVDTQNGLWGFCTTTALVATDCAMAGSCQDSHGCSDGCGLTDRQDLSRITCGSDYCSQAILTFDTDQTFLYIACGRGPSTDHLSVSPTAEATHTSDPSTSSQHSTAVDTTLAANQESDKPSGSSSSPKNTSPASSDPPAESNKSESKTNNTGAIVGGVIGGLALVCISVLIGIWLLRRGRGPRDADSPLMVEKAKKPYKMAGWGPRELPAAPVQDPVELPGEPLATPRRSQEL